MRTLDIITHYDKLIDDNNDPYKIDDITEHIASANMHISNRFETVFAYILICSK